MGKLLRPFSIPGSEPSLKLARGEGSYVKDSDGRSYLDAAGGLWNVSLGQSNAQLIDEMHQQLKKMPYATLFDSTHNVAEQLAEELIRMTNGKMQYVYLSTTGTSAVEVALRMARIHHRAKGNIKKRILSFDLAYHGCSLANLSASGILLEDIRKWEDTMPDFQVIPSPADEDLSLQALSTLLANEENEIACLIMEPILGSGGVIVPTKGYCREVKRLCLQHDVLLIADEVATGGGRCGAAFASSLLDLEADVIVLSKGINSGYFPLGATLFSKRVIAPIESANIPIQFGSTQDGNPVGCVATLATLRAISESKLHDRANFLGNRIREALSFDTPLSVIKEVRGLGLMIGIELAHSSMHRPAYTEQEAFQVRRACREAGLLVYHFSSGISLFPPLTLSDDEASDLIDILHEVLSTFA